MNKIALLVLAGMASLTHAADSRIITYKEAIRIALERNVALRQAKNTAAADVVGVSEARMSFVPDLRLSASGSENFGRSFSETEGRIINESSRSANLGVSSGVTLFNGFANTAQLKGAKLASKASGLDLERARQTAVFQVASDFLALIQAQEQVRVRRESLEAESKLLEQIRTYVNAGAKTVADLYQEEANVASAQLTLTEAQRTADLARVDLIDTLQLDPGGIYDFPPPADQELATGELPALTDMLARALARRVDLAAEEARLGAAEQNERVARAGYWPDLTLSGNYGGGYTNVSPLSFTDQLNSNRGGSVGVGVSIPLFDRRSTAHATARAVLRTEGERITLEEQRQQVGLQVRRVDLDYRSARQQLDSAQIQQRAADQALQSVQQRYQAGAATLVEVSQARASEVQAASTLVSARYNLLFQRTLADYYLGDLDAARFSE